MRNRFTLRFIEKHIFARARENAGYVDSTQLAKIKDMTPLAANTSGCRGVYLDRRKGLVRQMIECIEVFKDGTLLIHFGGGYEIEEHI